AQRGDPVGREIESTVGVGQEDEVVLGAVALAELHDPQGTEAVIAAVARPSTSDSSASSQTIRRSRRNQDRCLRTNRRVAVTVSAAAPRTSVRPSNAARTCW